MLLLSRIILWDKEKHSLLAEFDINRDCIFFEDALDGIPAWVGFELMAQSICALSGLYRQLNNETFPFGFILSVSELALHMPVLRGTARIEVEEDAVVNNVYSFLGRVYNGQEKATTAKLTVMEADDISAVIR